jgi:hypothetical protein
LFLSNRTMLYWKGCLYSHFKCNFYGSNHTINKPSISIVLETMDCNFLLTNVMPNNHTKYELKAAKHII